MTSDNFLNFFTRVSPRRLEMATRFFCIALLWGLSVKNAVLGYWGLVIALVVLSGMLLINSGCGLLRRLPKVPASGLLVVLILTILLSTAYLGAPGAIWLFPVLIGLRFLAADTVTRQQGWVLVVLVPLVLLLQGDAANAARIFAAALISALYLWLAEGELVSLRSRLDQDEGRDPVTRAFTRDRMERDLERLPQQAPMGLILLRFEGLMTLRGQAKSDQAGAFLALAADRVHQMLSGRERLYWLGGGDFLITLVGWQSYQSYELGEQIRKSLVTLTCEQQLAQIVVQMGVSEVRDGQGFDAALDRAYGEISVPGAAARP